MTKSEDVEHANKDKPLNKNNENKNKGNDGESVNDACNLFDSKYSYTSDFSSEKKIRNKNTHVDVETLQNEIMCKLIDGDNRIIDFK